MLKRANIALKITQELDLNDLLSQQALSLTLRKSVSTILCISRVSEIV